MAQKHGLWSLQVIEYLELDKSILFFHPCLQVSVANSELAVSVADSPEAEMIFDAKAAVGDGAGFVLLQRRRNFFTR